MAEAIGTPITTESVLSLKQSCQTIISAYQKYALSLAGSDENGIYPILLGNVRGLKTDIEAGVDSLNKYDSLSLDDIKRPSKAFGELDSYKDIENVSGNYTISQSVYDEAKDEVEQMFGGMKGNESPRIGEAQGSKFNSSSSATEEPGDNTNKYLQSMPKAELEQINSGEEQEQGGNPEQVVSGRYVDVAGGDEVAVAGSAEHKESSTGKFLNTIQKECIPCDLRLNNLDEFGADLKVLDPWEELNRKYNELKKQYDALFTNTDIHDDLCNLLTFLDFQCLPDLYAIIALLFALMRKLTDAMPNFSGAFLSFIGPFFTPLLGGLNELLDKYLQMIMGPVDCVMNALDTQLAKLDVVRAIDQSEVQNVNFHRRREGSLRRKIEQLKERRAFLQGQVDKGADINAAPKSKIGGRPRSSQSNFLRDILENDPDTPRAVQPEISIPFAKTTGEELTKLNQEIEDLNQKYAKEYGPGAENNITTLLKESQNPKPSVFREVAGQVGNARGTLRDARTGLASGLYELRTQILNARGMVNDTIRLMQDELQRLILGRAATSEEFLEGARNIQKVARLIGLVKTLKKLAKTGNLCENNNGDPSLALGSFLTADRGINQVNNGYSVYKGTNDGGEESLLIAPSDAILALADPETDTVRQLDDLSEITELNNNGIPVDLGDITDKKVTATIPELGTQVPVAIIAFDLCKNSMFSTEPQIEKIQQWASDAGLGV